MRKVFANRAEMEAELSKLREQGYHVLEFYHVYGTQEGMVMDLEYTVYPPGHPQNPGNA